jgi:amino acid transporter
MAVDDLCEDRPEQAANLAHGLRRELGLGDLVLAQVLCVVGSSWVGIAAKLGRTHVVMWLAAMLSFYVPLAVVVIYLNRLMPLEGGLYQWAKAAFREAAGFLIAWNLWVYAVIVTGAIIFVVPTDLGYLLGESGAWLPSSKPATLGITAAIMVAIAAVAVRGLDLGKWLHNIGSGMILLAYAILLGLPLWALTRGALRGFDAIPLAMPKLDFYTLAIYGQMTVGALSGFEYVAILAGECRSAARTVGQSVMISAPVISLMFILGTSSVLAFNQGAAINVIGPIPQTMRIAFGTVSWIAPFAIGLVIARAIASASLIFTGLTRLPMVETAWCRAGLHACHPTRRTPVNSILFVAILVMILVLLSMLGAREQEASQLLAISAVVHYAIAYTALFAIPLFGKLPMPRWLRPVAWTGLVASGVSLFFSIYPIVDVASKAAYAGKIMAVVVVANLAGMAIYAMARQRS